MTENATKQTAKTFTTQTVRVPKNIEKLIKHRMVEAGESFQAYALRLILEDIAASIPNFGDYLIPKDNAHPRTVETASTTRAVPIESNALPREPHSISPAVNADQPNAPGTLFARAKAIGHDASIIDESARKLAESTEKPGKPGEGVAEGKRRNRKKP